MRLGDKKEMVVIKKTTTKKTKHGARCFIIQNGIDSTYGESDQIIVHLLLCTIRKMKISEVHLFITKQRYFKYS